MWLTIAKLIAVADGRNKLSEEDVKHALALE